MSKLSVEVIRDDPYVFFVVVTISMFFVHLSNRGLVKARADKERKYAELINGDRCRLVVVGVETGGRWSDEPVTLLDHLASARAREAPPILRGSAFFMWRRRWSRMLAVACGRAFAQSLVSAAEGSWSHT